MWRDLAAELRLGLEDGGCGGGGGAAGGGGHAAGLPVQTRPGPESEKVRNL